MATNITFTANNESTEFSVAIGSRGPAGATGATGANGATGATGAQGDRAGLKYTFDTSTSAGSPSAGYLKFNSSTLSAVTRISIRDTDFDGTNTSALLALIDDSTSTIKARVVIRSNSNADTSHFNFLVTSVTDEGNHHHINGTYVSGSAFDNNEVVTFDFYATGDKGDQGRADLTNPLRVALVGTSITAQSSAIDTTHQPRIHDTGAGYGAWLEHISGHRVRLVRNYGTAESASQKTFGYSGYQLPGLTDGASGVYPLDNALNSGAEMLVLEGGINDIITGGVSAATLITRLTSYWTKAVSTGLPVIAFNCTPYGGGATAAASMTNGNTYEIYSAGTTTWTSFGAADNNVGTVFVKSGSAGTGTGVALDKSSATATTRRDNIATANASLSAIATSLGVTLIDTHALATMSGGFATTESLWDGIHPTPAYAHRLAVAINTQIASSYAARPPATIVPPSSSAIWVTTNNSPSQATIPTGWAKGGSAFTDTWSAQTDADGTTWQRVRVVPSVANTAGSIYIRATTGLKQGERVRFACRLRPVSGTHTLRDITILGRVSGSNASFVNFRAISQGSNLGTGNFNPITGLFISPEFTVPPFVTSLNATSMVAGKQYEILTVGTTDFTLVGAVNNTVGTRFIATAAGTGTGTVINPVITDPVIIDAFIDFTATDVTYDIRQFGVFKVISNE